MSISKTLLVLIALTGAQLANAKTTSGNHNPPGDKTIHINQSVPPDPYGVLNSQAIIKHNPPGYGPVLAGLVFHNPPIC
jgi:hypothetical protein